MTVVDPLASSASIEPSVAVNERQLHILRHSLGLNDKGHGRQYRNHFVTGEGSDDFDDCCVLVGKGLMTRRPGSVLTGGDDLFVVTEAGMNAAGAAIGEKE